MSGKYSENKLVIEFTQNMYAETVVFPYALIRDYQVLDIDEKQLAVLLRIMRPYFQQGQMTLLDIAEEFAVNEDEAHVLVLPFIDRKLLELSKNSGQITCNGMMDAFYENWISNKRRVRKSENKGSEAYTGISPENRELIRNLTHLFHVFEQEIGKNLTPLQSEEIRSWLEQDKIAPELIEEALKRAVMQEKRTFAYIKSILRRWNEAGLTTLEDVLEKDKKPQTGGGSAAKKTTVKKKSVYDGIYDKY